jgi:hypothetical protein
MASVPSAPGVLRHGLPTLFFECTLNVFGTLLETTAGEKAFGAFAKQNLADRAGLVADAKFKATANRPDRRGHHSHRAL